MDTDAALFQAIVAEFKNSPILHYVKLSLRVEDREVTISGRVTSLEQRKAVERAARRVAGIRMLTLEIQAALPVSVHNSKISLPL